MRCSRNACTISSWQLSCMKNISCGRLRQSDNVETRGAQLQTSIRTTADKNHRLKYKFFVEVNFACFGKNLFSLWKKVSRLTGRAYRWQIVHDIAMSFCGPFKVFKYRYGHTENKRNKWQQKRENTQMFKIEFNTFEALATIQSGHWARISNFQCLPDSHVLIILLFRWSNSISILLLFTSMNLTKMHLSFQKFELYIDWKYQDLNTWRRRNRVLLAVSLFANGN